MKRLTTSVSEIPALTIGIDLSDRTLRYCELDDKGSILKEGSLKLTRAVLARCLAAKPTARVAFETGGQSAPLHRHE